MSDETSQLYGKSNQISMIQKCRNFVEGILSRNPVNETR